MQVNKNSTPSEIARSLIPLISDCAEKAERQGELAAEVLAQFRRHNLWGMYVPVAHGGLGIGPVEGLKVLEAASYGDASHGWVLAVAFAAAVSMAYMPEDGVATMLGPDKRIPVIAGSGRPDGKAVLTDGGFMLTGAWNYGSGVRHADFILVGAMVMDGDKPKLTPSGMPEIRLLVVPQDKVRFAGNWDVIGLKATASVDYAIDNVFVPESFSYPITAQSGRMGQLFRLGYASLVPIGHAGWALGVGRRILDEIAIFAQGKKIPGGVGLSESFQEQFAHHEASFRAARAWLMELWPEIEKKVEAGGNLTTREETLIRLSLNNITTVMVDIANFAYRAGGGTTLRAGVLQRFIRDALAGAQHITSSVASLRSCGKDLAGLAPGAMWMGWTLIDPPKK